MEIIERHRGGVERGERRETRADLIERYEPELKQIYNICLNYFDNSVEINDTRIKEAVRPRQVAHTFAKKYSKASLYVIGLVIGNKDHATVLHSAKAIENEANRYNETKKRNVRRN